MGQHKHEGTGSNGGRPATTQTLGDLLFADPTRARVSEADWVKLVHSIASGDQLALRALYERMHCIVFTLIMRITHDRQTAEELTVDVFHDVWRRASSYDAADGTVVGWIMNQARSRAIDRLRYEGRKKRIHPQLQEPPRETGSRDVDVVELRDQNRVLRTALTALTGEERQAIETAYFSELTHAEVAARLNQPLGTVKTRIRSGLLKLRQVLGAGVKRS